MTTHVISEQVDIYHLPANRSGFSAVCDITLGDLHANPIKLIFTLIREGVCSLSLPDYQRLVEIYLEMDSCFQCDSWNIETKEHVSSKILEFKTIVNRLCLINKTIHIRLIGDELADRGCNDWFVLLVLDKLHHEHISINSILSNHLADFIEAIEHYDERKRLVQSNPQGTACDFLYGTTISSDGGIVRSLANLSFLVQQGILQFKEIEDCFNRCYKKMLCLLDTRIHSTDGKTIIFSHAPIGLKAIFALASCLHIPYHDILLSEVIQYINQYFNLHYLHGFQKISTLYLQKSNHNLTLYDEIHFILWNRDGNNEHLVRPSEYNHTPLLWVHGHDYASSVNRSVHHVVNLDNVLGKKTQLNQGEYTLLINTLN